MSDIYTDSPVRYKHDAEFRVVVDALCDYGRRCSLTPGELKQIAAFAALKLEIECARPAYALGFGPWWVCPRRTITKWQHSIAQQEGDCIGCGMTLIPLLPATNHAREPFRKA